MSDKFVKQCVHISPWLQRITHFICFEWCGGSTMICNWLMPVGPGVFTHFQIDFEFILAQMHFGFGRHYYFTICMQMPVIPNRHSSKILFNKERLHLSPSVSNIHAIVKIFSRRSFSIAQIELLKCSLQRVNQQLSARFVSFRMPNFS